MRSARHLFIMLDNRPEAVSHEVQASSGIETPQGPVSCYRKPESEIGLVIPLSEVESATFRPDVQSQAIKLTRLKVNGSPSVRLSLHAPHHRETFYIFADEVLQAIQKEPEAAVNQAAVLLQRWRQFFALAETSEFSIEKEIGLLCELEVLDQLLDSGVEDAIQRWAGPDRARHDFLLRECAIECKATRQANGLTVSIHGSHQLEPNAEQPLILLVRRYEIHPDGQLSVPELVHRIRQHSHVSVELLLTKLTQVGVTLADHQENSVFHRFSPREHYEFDVTEDFPRITPVGLADRVQNVRYSLDLADPESIPGFRDKPSILPSHS